MIAQNKKLPGTNFNHSQDDFDVMVQQWRNIAALATAAGDVERAERCTRLAESLAAMTPQSAIETVAVRPV